MKKKRPSLLDIEMFAQKRAQSKQDELDTIEAQSLSLESPEERSLKEDLPQMDTPIQEYAEPGSPLGSDRQEQMINDLVEIATDHKNEIQILKNELFKLKEQVRVYNSILNNQHKKINQLDQKIQEEDAPLAVPDSNYNRLVLRNIIWLKEEKGFSSNDVVRLFRAEGFQTPPPHKAWNEKVVELLYMEAKRTIY